MEKEEYFADQKENKTVNSEFLIKFSAEIIELRDAMLKQLEPFETPVKIKKLKKLVDKSSDTLRKLAGLAARIQIIRSRLTELASFRLGKPLATETTNNQKTEQKDDEDKNKIDPNDKSNWIYVRTVKQGDINGVDLDEGIKIKVSPKAVERLKSAGLVEVVPVEENEKVPEETKEAKKEGETKEAKKEGETKEKKTKSKKESNKNEKVTDKSTEKSTENVNDKDKEESKDKEVENEDSQLLKAENIGENKKES